MKKTKKIHVSVTPEEYDLITRYKRATRRSLAACCADAVLREARRWQDDVNLIEARKWQETCQLAAEDEMRRKAEASEPAPWDGPCVECGDDPCTCPMPEKAQSRQMSTGGHDR